jgi:hypothetical protein
VPGRVLPFVAIAKLLAALAGADGRQARAAADCKALEARRLSENGRVAMIVAAVASSFCSCAGPRRLRFFMRNKPACKEPDTTFHGCR